MEGENGFSPNTIEELLFRDIQGDQKEGECGATGSIIDDLHSSDI